MAARALAGANLALGLPVIGLGEQSADYADLPLQWMPHIQVADVTVSVQRALDAGGSVLMQSTGDAGAGSWAVLRDPNQAAFGIIPVIPGTAIPEVSREVSGPVGCIAWLDLTVPDATATCEFYQHVVGWSPRTVKLDDGGEPYDDFSMLGEDGEPAAGVCHARGANAELPGVWTIYLPVGDLAESLRRVPEEGGTVCKAATGEDGKFTWATIRDPVGVHLALLAV